MYMSVVQILHIAVRNIISLYQQKYNELKNKKLIKNIISELADQVNINCLFNCHMSRMHEQENRNICPILPGFNLSFVNF